MHLKEYCKAPYSLQYLKYLNYVRVFNSEPFLIKDAPLEILYTPCCGFKCVYLNFRYNFKKIFLYDISPAQITFFKSLIKNWNGKLKISDFILNFKKKYQTSIFKTDVKDLKIDFYDIKFNQMINQYYSNNENFVKAWEKFLNTPKDILKLDITKEYKKIKTSDNCYFSFSNIFEFEIASCFLTEKQRKDSFKKCMSYFKKSNKSLFELKFLNNNGIFNNEEIINIAKSI